MVFEGRDTRYFATLRRWNQREAQRARVDPSLVDIPTVPVLKIVVDTEQSLNFWWQSEADVPLCLAPCHLSSLGQESDSTKKRIDKVLIELQRFDYEEAEERRRACR